MTRVRLTRLAVAIVAATTLAALGWFTRSPIPEVDVALATQNTLVVRVNTNGVIEPIEKSELRARIRGRIIHVPEAGARMAAGELLLQIADAEVSSELARTESVLLSAQESLADARRALDRARRRAETDAQLHAKGGLTPERQRETQADLESAEARVAFLTRDLPFRIAAFETRIQDLESQLEAATLHAAAAGTVYQTLVKVGEMVAVGDLVLRFADLDRLRVRANIDQVDLGAVALGQSVRISSNAYPGREWSARVSALIPNIVKKEARLVAESLANIEPPSAGLIPGMTVDVEILVDSDPQVLQIPSGALFSDIGGPYVLTLANDRLRAVRVEVGRRAAGRVEIVSGLEEGDRVVVGPLQGLAEGSRAKRRRGNGG